MKFNKKNKRLKQVNREKKYKNKLKNKVKWIIAIINLWLTSLGLKAN